MEGKERTKKEADHSGLVGGRSHKQENLTNEACLRHHKMSRSLYTPARILKFLQRPYLTGFSHLYHPNGYVLRVASSVEKASGLHIPRRGE